MAKCILMQIYCEVLGYTSFELLLWPLTPLSFVQHPPRKHNAPALTLRRFRDICVGFCAGVLLWCLCNCNWCWLFDSLNVETNRWATRTENENWNWNRNWNWAPVEQLTAVRGGVLHKPRTGERWQLWLVVWQFCDLNSIMTCKKLAGGLPTREILLLQIK